MASPATRFIALTSFFPLSFVNIFVVFVVIASDVEASFAFVIRARVSSELMFPFLSFVLDPDSNCVFPIQS